MYNRLSAAGLIPQKSFVRYLLVWIGGFLVGLVLTREGLIAWDDWEHIAQSRWLVSKYGLVSGPELEPTDIMKWYAPLWELIMGLFSEVFLGFLRDPAWVRHALTFSLFPVTLYATFRTLRFAGYSRETGFVVVTVLLGLIRFGGHAAVNTKDFPFACGFWMATLLSWRLFRQLRDGRRSLNASVIWLGVLSAVPYLLRSPMLLHFAVAFTALAWTLARPPSPLRVYSPARRAGALGTFFGAFLLTVVTLYPMIWEAGFSGWMDSLKLFGKFPWVGPVRFWGETVMSNQLPWWYPFAWIPVLAHPLALAAAAAGFAGVFLKALPKLESPESLFEDLRLWIAAFVVLAWGAVVFKGPVLYDEERHILFLYPALFGLFAIGAATWPPRYANRVALVLAVASLASYTQWGRFSYVYKGGLLGKYRAANAFMGDYWGLCVTRAMADLKQSVQGAADLAVIGPSGIATVQLRRYAESAIAKDESFARFTYREPQAARPPMVVIGINRVDMMEGLRQAVTNKQALAIGTVPMPPDDDAACLSIYIPGAPRPAGP